MQIPPEERPASSDEPVAPGEPVDRTAWGCAWWWLIALIILILILWGGWWGWGWDDDPGLEEPPVVEPVEP